MEKLNTNTWISGFVDGEGCFSISFNLRKKMKNGIEVRPSFSISQKKDIGNLNYKIVNSFRSAFKGGFVRFSKSDQSWKYETRNVKHIVKKIIPYFQKNQLLTAKKLDFDKFSKICFLINSNHHLSLIGIKEIIEIAHTMNFSGKRKYLKDYLLKLLNEMKI